MRLKIPHRYLKFIFWLSISVCLSAEAYSQSVFTGSIQEEQLKLHMLLADSLTVSPVNRLWTYSAYDRFIPSETHSRKWWERSMTSASFTHEYRKSTPLHSTHVATSYAVFYLNKKKVTS